MTLKNGDLVLDELMDVVKKHLENKEISVVDVLGATSALKLTLEIMLCEELRKNMFLKA